LHRLEVARDLRCFQQVANDRFDGGIARDGISILGNEVQMR
jgi:hypothetical protein